MRSTLITILIGTTLCSICMAQPVVTTDKVGSDRTNMELYRATNKELGSKQKAVKNFIKAMASGESTKVKECIWPVKKAPQIIDKHYLASDTGLRYISELLVTDVDSDALLIKPWVQWKGAMMLILPVHGALMLVAPTDNETREDGYKSTFVPIEMGEYAYMLVQPKVKLAGSWSKLPEQFSSYGIAVALEKRNNVWKVDAFQTDLNLRFYSTKVANMMQYADGPAYGLIDPDPKNPDMDKWFPVIHGMESEHIVDDKPSK